MADVVRLAIIYDTSQAAQAVTNLNTKAAQLGGAIGATGTTAVRSSTHLRSMALAGTHLAHALNEGNLSVRSLATAVGHLAGATAIGGLLITVVNIIHALEEYKRISDDVTATMDAMQTSARDARADVARLLGEAPPESNAEKAVKRLRDAVAQMRKEAARLRTIFGGGAGAVLDQQADALEGQISGIGRRAARQPERERLKKIADATKDYNKELQNQGIIMGALGAGPMEQLSQALDLQRKHYEALVRLGVDPASERMIALSDTLRLGEQRLGELETAARRWNHMVDSMQSGLESIAGSLEEFVQTGTFAFSQLINNLLMTMMRIGLDDLIAGILPKRVSPHTGAPIEAFQEGGIVPGSGPQLAVVHGGEEIIPAGRGPSLATHVTFTVMAMDSRSVEQFFEQHGGLIAAKVAGAASRSAALRRRLTR